MTGVPWGDSEGVGCKVSSVGQFVTEPIFSMIPEVHNPESRSAMECGIDDGLIYSINENNGEPTWT